MTNVTVPPGSRLEQLLYTYRQRKSAADAAAANLKTIVDSLKLELQAAAGAGGGTHITATVKDVAGLDVTLTYVESWRLDTKKMKEQDPALYVRYAKKSGAWTLKQVT